LAVGLIELGKTGRHGLLGESLARADFSQSRFYARLNAERKGHPSSLALSRD